MRRSIFTILALSYVLAAAAQQKPAGTTAAKPAPAKGRNIGITLTPIKNAKVYLGSYYGESLVIADSAMLDEKSHGAFKGATKLTGGVYFLVSPQKTMLPFDLLMDKEQQFTIAGDTLIRDHINITGSAENDLYKSYSSSINDKGRALAEIDKQLTTPGIPKSDSVRLVAERIKKNKELQAYREDIVKKHPTTMLAILLNAMHLPETPAIPVINGRPDSSYPYRYVKSHYWDDVLFNDDRLMRTPFFDRKMNEYFKYYVSQEPDSIIKEVKYILLSARTGKEIYPYLLTKFTNKYIKPEYMGQDKVFLYLFENFYAKGDTMLLNPSSRKAIVDEAYKLMANQLGSPAPPLDLTDTSGKISSLYNITAPFTVVVFWDPNCSHCKEEIPKLDSFYEAKWKKYGTAVYSVYIYNNDLPAWKHFIREKNLTGWTHVYETSEARNATEKAGRPSYRQLYHVETTPTLYLLDKDKHIIAKMLSLEQFDDLMEAKRKTTGK